MFTDKSATEIVKSAAFGIVAGVSSAYWKYAISLADKGASAAKTLMKYDEELGKALEVFFNELMNILSTQF